MKETMYDFPSRLKILRDKYGYTQSELAKKLSITRAIFYFFFIGLSARSTPFLVELSRLFHVTTDYLLGLDDCITIRTDNLTDREITAILNIVESFHETHKEFSSDND